jgi:hypothetical protein
VFSFLGETVLSTSRSSPVRAYPITSSTPLMKKMRALSCLARLIRPTIGTQKGKTVRMFQRKRCWVRPSRLAAFSIRPLPRHFTQRGGYILRPGWARLFTADTPVPLHAGHACSVRIAGRFITWNFPYAAQPLFESHLL